MKKRIQWFAGDSYIVQYKTDWWWPFWTTWAKPTERGMWSFPSLYQRRREILFSADEAKQLINKMTPEYVAQYEADMDREFRDTVTECEQLQQVRKSIEG